MWILGVFFSASLTVQSGITIFTLSSVKEAVAQHQEREAHDGALERDEFEQYQKAEERREQAERRARTAIAQDLKELRKNVDRQSREIIQAITELKVQVRNRQ